MGMARHSQSTQRTSLVFLCNVLKKKQPLKEVSDKAGFLHANKHESFLQINTMIFDGDCQASPKFPR